MEFDKIKQTYSNFFKEFKINSNTGELNDYPSLKFSTMPYIGSKYEISKKKILFIGMDIGKDETSGYVQDFKERRDYIEKDINFNPHIAGTYCAALFLLKDLYNWETVWENFSKYPTYSQATKFKHHAEGQNPLSYIALTNLHKFVTNNRKNRAGDSNRKFLKRETEENILLREVKLLNPEIILFQGLKLPSRETIEKIKEDGIRVIGASHPSYRKKGGRKPEIYIKTFKDL